MSVKNMVGQRFGRLVVLERDLTKTGGAAYWICQCDCGNKKSIRGTNLRASKNPTRSCGCLVIENRKKAIDTESLVGKVFGRLTVKERDYNRLYGKGHPSYWICQCECGNMISVCQSSLVRNHTSSCGCLKKDYLSKANSKDIGNLRFGHLVAIKRLPQQKHSSWLWECKCDCGNTCIRSAETLLANASQSCGCYIRKSKGEEKIEKILKENHISFKREYSFPDLKDKCLLRYDFALFLNDFLIRLIEFDGEQHFVKKNNLWDKEDQFEIRQQHDQIKNEYALSHNIPLVRIPYTELKNINLEMLLGNDFLIKENK